MVAAPDAYSFRGSPETASGMPIDKKVNRVNNQLRPDALGGTGIFEQRESLITRAPWKIDKG